MKTKLMITPALILGALLATCPAIAEDHENDCPGNDRRGWVVGFDFGIGAAGLEFKRPSGNFKSDEEQAGSAFGVRAGYGLSDKFTLTLDAQGFEVEDEGLTTAVGSTVVMATWYPGGGGFFVRGGAGWAHVETTLAADATVANAVAFKEHGGVMAFGLGYEWRVSRRFALGLSLDARGITIGDFDDLTDVKSGTGVLGMQFGWYL